MVILLLMLLGILAIIGIVILFKILKWVFRKKERAVVFVSLVAIVGVGVLVYQLFFIKVEFIQSNVYPTVYLVKNQTEDKEALRNHIKEMIIEKMNPQIHDNEEILKTIYNYSYRSVPDINASIQFYEYYDTWDVVPFGEAGTGHFIENAEDQGGFSSELLQHYQTYKIAEFTLRYCESDTINYFGRLTYWEDGHMIKTDKLFNTCKP